VQPANRSDATPVDLPTAIVDAQLQEMAYDAVLATISRVLQPSLRDFLR
jgi:flagellar hook-associated protein 3 FlgL